MKVLVFYAGTFFKLENYTKLKDYCLRDSYCLCHGVFRNLWILDIAAKKMEEFEMIPHSEMKEKVQNIRNINLLPQERMNPGFMNGYGGMLYKLLLLRRN